MGFSAGVRRGALVAAARHCCVCHRYGGVKVEVHHIKQEADGGPNTIENAICLCFDCHTDAGHYNPRHPRGTKYSPEELRTARDAWHARVAADGIQAPDKPEAILCYYLATSDISIFHQLTQRKNVELPTPWSSTLCCVTNVTPVSAFHQWLCKTGLNRLQQNDWWAWYESKDIYLEQFADAVVRPDRQYFIATRSPTRDEIAGRLSPLIDTLLEAGIPAEELARIAVSDQTWGCGDFPEGLLEEVSTLSPLALYLALQNVSDEPVVIRSVDGIGDFPDGIAYRPFGQVSSGGSHSERFPRAPIPPGATVLLPVGTMLSPFESDGLNVDWTEHSGVDVDDVRWPVDTVGGRASLIDVRQLKNIGGYFAPRWLTYETLTSAREAEIHQFDPDRLYAVRADVFMGSCPHIFLLSAGARGLIHAGEILQEAECRTMTHEIRIAEDVELVVIAELEDEVTFLKEVTLDGVTLLKNIRLTQGESIKCSCVGGGILRVSGSYAPARQSQLPRAKLSLMSKQLLVDRFLRLGFINTYSPRKHIALIPGARFELIKQRRQVVAAEAQAPK